MAHERRTHRAAMWPARARRDVSAEAKTTVPATVRPSRIYGGRDEAFERTIADFMRAVVAEVAAVRASQRPGAVPLDSVSTRPVATSPTTAPPAPRRRDRETPATIITPASRR